MIAKQALHAKTRTCWIAVCFAIVAAVDGGPAQAAGPVPDDFDVYKYSAQVASDLPGLYAVPDVDLAAHGHDGMAYQWLATAANLLGGAGYGEQLGDTPQARADQIYLRLVADLGQINNKDVHRAVSYWLYTYGRNPDRFEFQPDNTYADVTRVQTAGLQVADYQFLLDELDRCQYVAVRWYFQADSWGTLVGGDYGDSGSQSIWHDADCDNLDIVYVVDDDVHVNNFGQGRWDLLTRPNRNWASEYVTLCPGLSKPVEAMINYDAAYYMQDPDRNGEWDPMFRAAGNKAGMFGAAMWMSPRRARIFNEFQPDHRKEIHLLIDYVDRVAGRDMVEMIRLEDDMGASYDPSSVQASPDEGQLLLTWVLPNQPPWEVIVFPDDKYKFLDDDVLDWNVATICVQSTNPADFDEDGDVDLDDFIILKQNWGSPAPVGGDADGDGDVDLDDFVILKQNWGL